MKEMRLGMNLNNRIVKAVTMEELIHEFERLWIYKRLHIRIG